MATGVNPYVLAVADLNGDGKLDLAVVNQGSNSVSILLGNGNGTFAPAISVPAGIVPAGVAVGDFNGDGKLDLMVSSQCGTLACPQTPTDNGTATILLGDGTGNFPNAVTLSAGAGNFPFLVAAGDFDGEGRMDFVTSNAHAGTGTVSIFMQTPVLTAVPTSVDFGDQNVSATSGQQIATITNSGSDIAPYSAITITPTAPTTAGEYAFDTPASGTHCVLTGGTLAVGSSCTVAVTFTPAARGGRPATLNIPYNASTSPLAISLLGNGVVATTTSISAPDITYGSSGLVTVTVSAPVGTPTGSVSLTVDSSLTPITQPLVSGATTFTLTGLNAGSHSLGANYARNDNFLASSKDGSLTVNKKDLTASIINNPSKTYDGNTNATLAPANFSITGLVGSDSFTVTKTSGTYNSKDVLSANTVSTTLAAGDFTPVGGTLAANYNLPATASGAGTITAKHITGSFTANNKVYDGNTSASVLTETPNGIISPDVVTLTGGTATFATKTVANGKTVTLTGATLSGADSGNYVLDSVATTMADITPATVYPHVTASNKTYDGTPAATILTRTLTGVISPDDVSLSGGTATFSDTNAGMGKTVTATGLGLSGGDAGNYQLSSTSATTTANIDKANALISVTLYHVTYDASAHTATGTATGVESPTPANLSAQLTLTGTTHTDAGDYPADAWSFAGGTNYNDASGTVHDIINKASSTTALTFEAGPYTYRGTAFTATAAVTGVGGLSTSVTVVYSGDCLNVSVTNGCTATATFAGDTNHTTSTDSKSITIAQASSTTVVSVAGGVSFTYDGNSHPATVLVTGVGGLSQTPAPVYSCGHAPINVADSGCTASYNFAGDIDHTGSSDSKTYTIGKANAAITVTPYSVTYDAAAHTATGAAIGVKGESLSGLVLTGTTHTAAGDYPTDAWTFTDITGNYNNANSTVHDSIGKALLTVTADNKTMTLHGTVPSLTFKITGFKGVDTASVLTTQPTCTTTGTSASNVGPYPITCSGGAAANYTFTYVPGTLSILYATGTVCSNGMMGHQINQPINLDGSSVFKFGSTVPVKFTVCDINGVPISTTVVESFTVAGYIGGTVSGVNETIASTTPDTAFRYDPTAQQWIYNFATSGLSKNATAVFVIALNDGTIVGPAMGGLNVVPGASSFQFGLK